MNQRVAFAKMNGIGNKIIVADMRARVDHITPNAAVALAADPETHFDQIMAVHSPGPVGKDARIEIFNSDGSMSDACGNGTRCVVQWLNEQTGTSDFSFEVEDQPLTARLLPNGHISVNMGAPRFSWDQIPLSEEFADTSGIELEVGPLGDPILHTPSVVNVGNPHAVFWASEDVNSYALDKFGPMLEHHPLFPERVNISIAQQVGDNEMTMRTWERGAGLTLACGSAACAVAVCASRLGKTGRQVRLNLPGGVLDIDWRDDNFIIMSGAAEHEFDGMLDPLTGAWERLP
ncbi:MAG: diaminopimelate epimerase [Rhizobiaceae bacterium]|nr:diaminopimelate epimerase [Rhizobiaceae bacterium]